MPLLPTRPVIVAECRPAPEPSNVTDTAPVLGMFACNAEDNDILEYVNALVIVRSNVAAVAVVTDTPRWPAAEDAILIFTFVIVTHCATSNPVPSIRPHEENGPDAMSTPSTVTLIAPVAAPFVDLTLLMPMMSAVNAVANDELDACIEVTADKDTNASRAIFAPTAVVDTHAVPIVPVPPTRLRAEALACAP